jgi:hypothetical protein
MTTGRLLLAIVGVQQPKPLQDFHSRAAATTVDFFYLLTSS